MDQDHIDTRPFFHQVYEQLAVEADDARAMLTHNAKSRGRGGEEGVDAGGGRGDSDAAGREDLAVGATAAAAADAYRTSLSVPELEAAVKIAESSRDRAKAELDTELKTVSGERVGRSRGPRQRRGTPSSGSGVSDEGVKGVEGGRRGSGSGAAGGSETSGRGPLSVGAQEDDSALRHCLMGRLNPRIFPSSAPSAASSLVALTSSSSTLQVRTVRKVLGDQTNMCMLFLL